MYKKFKSHALQHVKHGYDLSFISDGLHDFKGRFVPSYMLFVLKCSTCMIINQFKEVVINDILCCENTFVVSLSHSTC